jgi:hypothetical protein
VLKEPAPAPIFESFGLIQGAATIQMDVDFDALPTTFEGQCRPLREAWYPLDSELGGDLHPPALSSGLPRAKIDS